MDREKETPYVTHHQLSLTREQLRREISDGDKENLKLINNVDTRVDSIAVDTRGMRVSLDTLVELTKEQRADTKIQRQKDSEKTQRMFEKIEKNSEDIVRVSSELKAFSDKKDKSWKLKSTIIGGVFAIGTALFQMAKAALPIVEQWLFSK